MRSVLAAVVLLAALPVGAQQMYRCGNAFSQLPCGKDQAVIGAPAAPPVADLPASPETVAAASAECRVRLMHDVAFRDPDSVKIGRVDRRRTTGITVAGRPATARVYVLQVNAKNAFGGYTGDKPFFCYTDPADERAVFFVQLAPGY